MNEHHMDEFSLDKVYEEAKTWKGNPSVFREVDHVHVTWYYPKREWQFYASIAYSIHINHTQEVVGRS